MSCDPERVTGYVDVELDPVAREAIEGHLGACAACRDQAAFERRLREQLRSLPSAEPAPGLEARVRSALRPGRRIARWALPLAASLVLLLWWGRGAAAFVAWELVQDHEQCESVRSLALTDETLPAMPRAAAGLDLVAASLCQLRDGSVVVHLQYVGQERRVSAFIIRQGVHFGESYTTRVGRSAVRLTRSAGSVVGLVAERSEDLEAFQQALAS